jgi:nickel/cobalt transporter (NicO) family protein
MRGLFLSFLVFLSSLCLCVSVVSSVFAHPVPKQNHDRVIDVKLTPDAVVLTYQLEIDEYRAAQDLDKEELARIDSPRALPRVFMEYTAPILGNNLIARLDGKELAFQGGGEIDGTVTDHLRCNFTFTAAWKPSPDRAHTFTFREANYDQEDFDRIQLTLTAGAGIRLQAMSAPDKALWERPPLERKPGDSDRLRRLSATFVLSDAAPSTSLSGGRQPPEIHQTQGADAHRSKDLSAAVEEGQHPQNLLHLLLDTQRGLVVLLLLAAGFGAVHALTPGHGKTLVAAYLVGKHGTVWHALLLGLMTTLTHTGAVFVLAIVFLFSPYAAGLMYYLQGLVGGLLITGFGLWLLVQRLFGRPDHVHIGGHSHHHHHSHAHDHVHEQPPISGDGGSVRGWHLLLLGVRGGLVPCWDAILLLCLAISAQRLWLGIPLLLAFSAGLAGVLVALGMSVVWARDWAVTRWGSSERLGKVIRALPVASAVAITILGLWLSNESLHAERPPPTSHPMKNEQPPQKQGAVSFLGETRPRQFFGSAKMTTKDIFGRSSGSSPSASLPRLMGRGVGFFWSSVTCTMCPVLISENSAG